MIISRTPFRISFFGGGTDYPQWFREHGGSVLATTIDKYCYISCRYLPPFFDHKHRIVYSQMEVVKKISEIRHPAVRHVLEYLKMHKGLEIHHDADLPSRAGLGSSSAFTVGLINTLHALQNRFITKLDLARMAIHVEQELIREPVGCQDQISAAFGGFNRIDFNRDGTFEVSPLIIDPARKEELQGSLMLFFTGLSRNAFEIAGAKIDNFKNRGVEMRGIRAAVEEAIGILRSETAPIDQIGSLLHDAWQLKCSLSSKVTNPTIDEIYREGRAAGALGGKLLGAGGGGFILFYVKPEDQAKVKARLRNLLQVKFQFESAGSKVVLYDPQLMEGTHEIAVAEMPGRKRGLKIAG